MKTLLLLLLPTLLFAQDCKYEINEVDKFTKTKKVLTKGVKIESGISHFTSISGLALNEHKYLRIYMATYSLYSFRKNSNLMLMFDSDSVITLTAIDNSKSSASSNIWYTSVNYQITKDQLAYFISNKISSIRIYSSDGYIEKNVKTKAAIKLQKAFKCIQ